jgi:uncharacterized Fe-S cluster protein YjdI
MKDITKHYSNEDITIVWKPALCIHSTKCWKGEEGLLSVFNPSKKPWIVPDGAASEEIIKRVNACPSGALSFQYLDGKMEEKSDTETVVEQIVEAKPNGPLIVYGNIRIKEADGTETKRNNITAFCRCGASGNKPYCDGSHVRINFNG